VRIVKIETASNDPMKGSFCIIPACVPSTTTTQNEEAALGSTALTTIIELLYEFQTVDQAIWREKKAAHKNPEAWFIPSLLSLPIFSISGTSYADILIDIKLVITDV
jgi:hypothetical protein